MEAKTSANKVHQRMLKVRPISPPFVLVWNTLAAYGTHILKSISKILKEYNGKPPDL